jgi:hypothetical protein
MAEVSSSRGQNRSHRLASIVLCTSLTAGIVWPVSVTAQVTPSTPQPGIGMRATSPLATGSARSTGIPLGSTEIATPGISPVSPSQSAGFSTCAASDGASAAPFDGGGLSGTAPLSCADSRIPLSPLPSPSTVGRVGVPLGATELGGAGISPFTPVDGPGLSGSANPITSPGNP